MTAITSVAAALYPTSSVIITLTGQTVSKVSLGSQATAIYSICNDGTVKNHNLSTLETWLGGAGGTVADFQVRATVVSGALTGGSTATGLWLSCSSTCDWAVADSVADGDPVTAVITVEIRNAAAPNTVRATATINLSASRVS